jgi:hypothetical protein
LLHVAADGADTVPVTRGVEMALAPNVKSAKVVVEIRIVFMFAVSPPSGVYQRPANCLPLRADFAM